MKNPSSMLRVLHADDDDVFLLLMRRVTADPRITSRAQFFFVQDGSEAVDYALGRGAYADRTQFPLPHLILLDHRMTMLDGPEALAQIRATPRTRRIPAIILSTSTQDRLLEQCYANGATMCIEKPTEFAQLEPTIQRIVEFAIDVLALHREVH